MDRLTPLLGVGLLLAAAGCATPADTASPAGEATATQSPTPTPTHTPDQTATATASPTPTPTATAAEGAFEDPAECQNEEIGFEVQYPGDWWANERIEPEEETLTPIAACTFFAPQPVELQPNAGLPNGIAIRFEEREGQTGTTGEVLSREETTVDGHDAVVWETEPAPQPGFIPEGSLMYQYVIDLEGGTQLVATTDNVLQGDAAYQDAKQVLDTMMTTLEIDA